MNRRNPYRRNPPSHMVEVEFEDGHAESYRANNEFNAIEFARKRWAERHNYDPRIIEVFVVELESGDVVFHRKR